MSDPNKFINTYIDTTIATLHEYVGSSLQLKTQLKLANDLLVERDEIITQLSSEVENLKNNFSTNQDDSDSTKKALTLCQDKLKIAEESHNAISSKVSHMDTLLKQLSDMKNEIKTRDDRIASLNNDLVTKETQLLSCNKEIDNLNLSLIDKDKKILELAKKLQKLELPQPVAKNVKESSTVKVQLNTKTKTKDPDDDF
jgi:chromosome segregation ATPase